MALSCGLRVVRRSAASVQDTSGGSAVSPQIQADVTYATKPSGSAQDCDKTAYSAGMRIVMLPSLFRSGRPTLRWLGLSGSLLLISGAVTAADAADATDAIGTTGTIDESSAESDDAMSHTALASASDRGVDTLTAGWAQYTIDVGAHSASIRGGTAGNPLAWFTDVSGRDYSFRFNSTASYVLTHPTQPEDQLDWNKLPGFSDCGTMDLSRNGAMFGWRWRIDTTPKVLEVTAYANNNGTHLWSMTPLFTLDAADLTSDAPLRYRVYIDGAQYRFSVSGTVRGRTINATTTLPRSCPRTSTSSLKWASGLYFGGTSTAPSTITGHVSEIAFRP